MPEQATLLAGSEIYLHQAFSVGKNILALQFHLEVAPESLEKWLIGHTCELRKANVNIPALRADNQRYATALALQAQAVLQAYLKQMSAI